MQNNMDARKLFEIDGEIHNIRYIKTINCDDKACSYLWYGAYGASIKYSYKKGENGYYDLRKIYDYYRN